MITRLEVDGFKSFRNFEVNLRPFQILIGANGVGKSNLFDVIVLLSDLARDNTLYEAFRKNRGDIQELFTLNPNGKRAKTMKFAVEMLIPRTVSDALGMSATLSANFLRYELQIERRKEQGSEDLYVRHEKLVALPISDMSWLRSIMPVHHFAAWVLNQNKQPISFISTSAKEKTIYLHAEHTFNGHGKVARANLNQTRATVLSTIANVDIPTIYAVRQEMLNWRFLQLNPAKLRMPSSMYASTALEMDGSNLATVLDRMRKDDEYVLSHVSIDIANIVPSIQKISLKTLQERKEHLIYASTIDGSNFSSQVLSDGTLRILALVILNNDLTHQGMLCLEEPENGVHSTRLVKIVEILKSLSTDLTSLDSDSEFSKLRQVLINTHSPKLLSYAALEDFIYVFMTNQANHSRTTRIGYLKPPSPLFDDETIRYFTAQQIKIYLDPSEQNDLFAQLQGYTHL